MVDLTQGLSNSQLRLLLSTNNLTDSQKIALMVANGTEQELAEQQLQTWGLINAQNGATASTVTLGTAMKGLTATMLANPIFLVTTAITLGVTAFSLYQSAVEKAEQRLSDLKSKLQETTSELESVESELKNINSQIDEILSKDSMTLTDENDLKRLQLENEELERRKKLLDLQKQEESKELNEAAEDEYKKKFQSKNVSVWIPEDERINTVNPNQTRATKSVTQEEKFAYNLKLAKELASYEGKITEEQAKKYEELQTYFLEQAESLSDIKDGYNAITPEQQEQLKIWNQMIDDAIWVSENFPGSAKNVTSRLMDKFAGGFNRNDGSTYLSTTDIDKQIAYWIDSLSDDEKKILLQCEIENASLDDLQDYLSEQKSIIEEESTIEVGLTFSYDKLEDIPQKLTEIENAYNTAKSAMEEYNEQGYYSIETIDSLLALEDQYVNTLIDENGQVLINTDTMNMLSIQKIEAAKASIYQEACEELVRIKTLDTALAAQELALINGTLTESAYETARALYEEVVAMGGANAALGNKVWETTSKKVKLLDNQIGHLKNGTYDLGKATKDTTDSAKSHIESYMEFQKKSLEKGTIDYNTYCNTVSNLLKSMFKDGKISAQDYHNYTKEMLDVQKDIYDKALSAISNLFDKEIEKQEDIIENIEKQNEKLEEQMTLMENAADAVVDYYDSLVDAEDDAIKGIEDQIDGYDALISVSDRLYESEQQALEAQKDAIQDKIDSLNDENNALDLHLRKEQALDELYKARNQRTKYIYAGEGKGFIYQTDTDAIRDAQQNVKDIETELIISQLEKEQEALDESISSLQKYRDAINDIADVHKRFEEESIVSNLLGSDYASIILGTNLSDWDKLKDVYISSNEEIKNHEDTIERLEEAKDQWTDLSKVVDDQIKNQAASEQFGADWKKKIQEGTLISFDEYKEMYLAIQEQINDNNSTIESIEEKIAYYETLKENYSSITTVYEEEEAKRYATMLMGQDWEKQVLNGRLDTLNNFKDEYIAIQNAMREAEFKAAQVDYSGLANSGGNGSGGSSNSPDVAETSNTETKSSKYRIVNANGNVIKSGFDTANDAQYYIVTYATPQEKLQSLRVEKYHTGLENGIIGKNLSIADKELLKILRRASNGKLASDEVPVIAREGEAILNKPQWTNLAKTLASSPIDYSHMFKGLNTSLPQNVVQKRDTNITQTFNISCPGVTSQQVIKELERQLQPMGIRIHQDLYKR